MAQTPTPLPLDCQHVESNSSGPKDLGIRSRKCLTSPFSEKRNIYIPAPPLLLANSANGNSMPLGFQVQILEGIQNSISLVPKSVYRSNPPAKLVDSAFKISSRPDCFSLLPWLPCCPKTEFYHLPPVSIRLLTGPFQSLSASYLGMPLKHNLDPVSPLKTFPPSLPPSLSLITKSKDLTWTYEAPYNVNLVSPWSNSLPQKSSCCCSNLLLPQNLCTCYVVCLEFSPSNYLPVLFRWFSGKESTCQCKRFRRLECNPWIGKIPCRRKWQPIPVFLLGKSNR